MNDWDEIDPEGPSPEDLERFGAELDPCPNCGEEVYDQAPICPHCGELLENKDNDRPPGWIVAVVVVVVVGFLLVFLF